MGVVSSPPPAETSADVASPCFDRTGSVQGCSPYANAVAKAIAKRPQSAAGGTVGSRGGPGMVAIFGPEGPIILPWTVQGDHFRWGTVHGVTTLLAMLCCMCFFVLCLQAAFAAVSATPSQPQLARFYIYTMRTIAKRLVLRMYNPHHVVHVHGPYGYLMCLVVQVDTRCIKLVNLP